MASPDDLLYRKSELVELSHAVEQFALAAPPGSPLAVIAMFQRESYFARAAHAYQEIAERGAVTLVGMVADATPMLPMGVRPALLAASDSLAREWSVTVLGPRGGATLVATDLERVDPTAPTLEHGRQFTGHWSFRRSDAYRETLRLRTQLRLPAATADDIDAVLRAVLDEPEPRHQDWLDVPLRFLAERMRATARERADATRALELAQEDGVERDPRTGVYTETYLRRWTAGLGAGTLPVGLVLVRVPGLTDLRTLGLRAELAAVQGVTGCVADLISDTDRIVRLGGEAHVGGSDDFLLVLPSWSDEGVRRLVDEVRVRLAALDQAYPFVALPAVTAHVVTRDRPLPLEQLMSAATAEERQLTGPRSG
ncbi:DICT sensory domain-containing protein [Pseudonocardia sp. TRM90224]|uniref:DICT sensory domain-containing protein n=1 Tax=Pseudonocardia sp. TRM90224 TaxID=2812678 RepID=UPI001E4E545C|nr:DICT sensory domain-containing protein [Pseudonocardia sp. TRM90224]